MTNPKPCSPPEKNYYIFIIDSSGSMQGDRWKALLDSMTENLALVAEKSQENRVAIVNFSSDALVEYENAFPSDVKVGNLTFQGGGTSFEAALQKGTSCLSKAIKSTLKDNANSNTDHINHTFYTMFFLSDGEDSYPEMAISALKKIVATLPIGTFQFIGIEFCCTNSSSLTRICSEFNGQKKKSFDHNSLSSAFVEALLPSDSKSFVSNGFQFTSSHSISRVLTTASERAFPETYLKILETPVEGTIDGLVKVMTPTGLEELILFNSEPGYKARVSIRNKKNDAELYQGDAYYRMLCFNPFRQATSFSSNVTFKEKNSVEKCEVKVNKVLSDIFKESCGSLILRTKEHEFDNESIGTFVDWYNRLTIWIKNYSFSTIQVRCEKDFWTDDGVFTFLTPGQRCGWSRYTGDKNLIIREQGVEGMIYMICIAICIVFQRAFDGFR